ncbi:MAG: class I adenylate-forming enzyme family protein [Candidatus Pelagadaptatus aseana]|uniref:class I adenylate-forming enzyme family protein n=1 Tax=Candidatus Pelagadaptatus aseana TaxID=3120508 RepID=UPI0039B294F7
MFTSFNYKAPLLPEIFALHGKWRAGDVAVVCDDKRLTWRAFIDTNHRLAHGLLAAGFKPGDSLGVVMSNGIPMLQIMLAAMAMGVVTVPINLSVNDKAMANMLNDASVKGIVATVDQIARLQTSAVIARIKHRFCDGKREGWISLDELADGQPATLPDIAIEEQAPLNIIYSSGTTGLPKGIVHTHRGRRDWAYDLALALRYHSHSRTLLTIGMYSNISWVGILCTLLGGGTLYIHKGFSQERFLETVDIERITHAAMVPIQYQRVVERFQQSASDVSSLQALMSCGSPLHKDLKQEIFRIFDCGIIELYGLTEGVITTLDAEDAQGRWASVGKPLLGTDIKILKEDDSEASIGEAGEIVSRGRITMPGYLNRPDANKTACFVDQQGLSWLRTGDVGYLDEDGYLFIVDRKKDMILSGGQNIYPQDIESVLIEHEAINDVAVIAANSRRWGESPLALIVPQPGQAGDIETLDAEILMGWANQRLGKQQRIVDAIWVDELPRNSNGKILKRELRKHYSDRVYD